MAVAKENRTYKIGEVCRLADLQPYVLRYWETEFRALAPNKGGGGQRAYTQREIDIILRIRDLLYKEGFTIAGAKKKLEAELDEKGNLQPSAEMEAAEAAATAVSEKRDLQELLRDTRAELRRILDLLD